MYSDDTMKVYSRGGDKISTINTIKPLTPKEVLEQSANALHPSMIKAVNNLLIKGLADNVCKFSIPQFEII